MKASEKRLASISGAILAIMAGLILGKHFQEWQKSIKHREELLSTEREMSSATLQEASVWDAREAWLAKHQPVAKSNLEADAESFDPLLQKAKDLGLTVQKKQYQEQTQTEFWHQCGANLTVTGPLPLVFRWIYSVQAPTEFRVVPSLKIAPLKDHPEQVSCSIQFWRWYQPTVAATASSPSNP